MFFLEQRDLSCLLTADSFSIGYQKLYFELLSLFIVVKSKFSVPFEYLALVIFNSAVAFSYFDE